MITRTTFATKFPPIVLFTSQVQEQRFFLEMTYSQWIHAHTSVYGGGEMVTLVIDSVAFAWLVLFTTLHFALYSRTLSAMWLGSSSLRQWHVYSWYAGTMQCPFFTHVSAVRAVDHRCPIKFARVSTPLGQSISRTTPVPGCHVLPSFQVRTVCKLATEQRKLDVKWPNMFPARSGFFSPAGGCRSVSAWFFVPPLLGA